MGWLDVLEIGIEAAQWAQLSKARGHLEKMEAERHEEIITQEIIKSLKNLVFSSLKAGEALEERINASPQPVYVGASLLEWRFDALDVSPEIFPDFSDKEYVQSVRDKIRDIIKRAKSVLNFEQVNDGDACIQAIVEMQTLEDAIAAYEAAETIEDLEPEWKKLNRRKNQFNLLALGVILVVPFVACTYSVLVQSGVSAIFKNTDVSNFACLIPVVASIISLVIGVFIFSRGSTSRFREIGRMKRELQTKVPKKDEKDIYLAAFGDRDSGDLKKLLESRNSLINRVMGELEDYDRFLLLTG